MINRICLTIFLFKKLDIPTRTISVSDSDSEIDLNFEPLVTLPEVELVTNEENEEELVKLRAKLFRFDTTDHDFPEWKVIIAA